MTSALLNSAMHGSTPADSPINHGTDVEDADTPVVEGNRIVDDYFSKITLKLGCSEDAIAGVIHFSGSGNWCSLR